MTINLVRRLYSRLAMGQNYAMCIHWMVLVVALIGCKTSKSASKNPVKNSAAEIEKVRDSSRNSALLPRVMLRIWPSGRDAVEIKAEVADNAHTRERGLMFRKHMGAHEGMLFVYPSAAHLVFWMKNTYIPLDMIFIGSDQRVVGVVENAEPLTETPREVDGLSQFVLELNGGAAAKYGIGVGTRVEIPEQTLQKSLAANELANGSADGLTESSSGGRPSPPEVEQPVKRTPTTPDPEKGKFTLAEATKGLPAGSSLKATIETSMGTLTCTLNTEEAPNTVANFVGLARGVRPWWDMKSAAWVRRPLYDGTSFHRVIAGFMIQGGDPLGDGTGEVGYVIDDEIPAGAKHDRAGLMCMANRGPNTNGCQFFITDGATPHLDGGYTIFGTCEPRDLISKIANVPKSPSNDRPHESVRIERITVHR